MRTRIPVAGAGISVSTLSVDTSTSGSSTWTVSPSCLSQRVTVPSVTLSPRAGIVTETVMRVDSSLRQPWVCSGLPASARCASPTASDWVGCGWISEATSSA